MRGCSGEPNNLPRSYHNGSSDDLDSIIRHVTALPYQKIMLIGFSLGGNVILKYLCEGQWKYPSALTAAAAISVPCHLDSCAHKLSSKVNRIYLNRFLKMLHEKIIAKKAHFPELFNDDGYESIRSFKDFDDRYTAPLHGFTNAEDYWKKASSLQYLPSITLPTLMISAADDPFLTPLCFPRDIAEGHSSLTLEITRHGGHLGFGGSCRNGEYWHERRTVEFLKENNY
jgi:predicted alpha/beta-fold hydrolase